MDVKEFLKRPKELKKKIDRKTEKLKELRDEMLPKAVNFEKERVQTSPHDPMPDFAAKVYELDQQIADMYNEYESALDDVEEVIGRIENGSAQLVMVKKYIRGKTIKQIEEEMFCSRRSVFNLQSSGLRAVEKILSMKEQEKNLQNS